MARQVGLKDVHITILKTDDATGTTYDTEAEKPKAQSAKLKGKFYSRDFDGNYGFIADEDMEGVDAAIIGGWFTAVPSEPTVV
ncbi:hypothetical protein [Clostridium sp.]|uniref:hypothetical protein n=1 Tax=Clostridium sp. TaxID=1506 RepID=UPI003217E75A